MGKRSKEVATPLLWWKGKKQVGQTRQSDEIGGASSRKGQLFDLMGQTSQTQFKKESWFFCVDNYFDYVDQAQFDDKAMEIFVFLFRKPIQFFVSLIKQWDLGGNFYMYLKKRAKKKVS